MLLGALALVLLLIALDVALIATTQAPAPAQAKAVIVRARLSAPVLPSVDLSVAPSIKPGPDGQLHDAFSVTDFHVHVDSRSSSRSTTPTTWTTASPRRTLG